MFLIDTDVISELRKGRNANSGVLQFFAMLEERESEPYLSAITIGELRRGIELLRHRRDVRQARLLERWLEQIIADHEENILEFGHEEAQVWGRLRVPHPENALDKQIAATALTRGLKLVTRNTGHFANLGLEVINPFSFD